MSSPLRILSLEDDAADAELVRDTLELEGLACTLTRVETEPGFVTALQQGAFDLILADYTLPSFDGLSALKIARRQRPDLPFIFVSGTMGEEVAIESLKIGASDYVLKTRLSRLVPSVQRALREAVEKAELRQTSTPLRILYLEDDAADAEFVQSKLEMEGMACNSTRVETEGDFIAALQQGGFDLILADYTLPSFDGLSALRIVRQQRPDLPFIFVSGTLGEEVAIEALKIGASDYILKSRLSRLVPSVQRALREAEENAKLRRFEVALRRSEQELRQVIQAIPAMVWSALPDASNLMMNSRWMEYTGSSAAGMGWQAAVHPEDLQRHIDDFRAASAAGQPFADEVRFRRYDGEYRWFYVQGVPLRDEQGNVLKWYGIVTDIEDRKRAEELQADLAHMNRMTMLSELASSLAHEINQPIAATVTSANACLRWLEHDPPELERARAAAIRIAKDGSRAAEIIQRLRAFCKKGAPPQRELVDINQVVGEMLVLLRDEVIRYSVALRTELAPHLPRIMADRVQLQQVLMNLMLNGMEAMKDGAGLLTIRSQPTENGQLLISVSDTGVGLPDEKGDLIFNAFYTTKPLGTGMGLPISRSIVEAHGGHLWATANPGGGATFHFTMPAEAHE